MKKVLFAILFLLVSTSLVFAASKKDDDDDNDDDDKTTISAQLALSTPDYMVTAGDIYTLAFAVGSSSVTYTIPVDSSYKIRVANLAVINASGKTFNQLKSQVEDIVIRNYPMSGVQFVLTTPATFKVTIEGEVTRTTIKQAGALTRLSAVLDDVFTSYSSNRNIVIKSTNGTQKTCDLFKAARFGELNQDPYLRPDDIIIISKIDRTVTINGAIKRPDTYTILPGENIKTLIDYYCDGLTDYADTSRIQLTRYNPETQLNQELYINQEDINSDMELKNHDSIYISFTSDLLPVMFIEGAITPVSTNSPASASLSSRQSIRFNADTNYAYLIRRNSSLFGPNSDLENAYIIRNEKIIKMDLTKILYDQSYNSDEIVQPNDVLMVPFSQKFVTVSGGVLSPGRYPYIAGRTWEYYVGLAGGFNPEINAFSAVTIKTAEGKKLKKSEPIPPEANIMAKRNAFVYNFNKYSAPITVVLTFITSIVVFIRLFTN